MDLDFQGRRVWMLSRPDNIFVVQRQMGSYMERNLIIEMYVRRPGVTQGPVVMLNHSAFPAGRP